MNKFPRAKSELDRKYRYCTPILYPGSNSSLVTYINLSSQISVIIIFIDKLLQVNARRESCPILIVSVFYTGVDDDELAGNRIIVNLAQILLHSFSSG